MERIKGFLGKMRRDMNWTHATICLIATLCILGLIEFGSWPGLIMAGAVIFAAFNLLFAGLKG